jgi:hypothetical protein
VLDWAAVNVSQDIRNVPDGIAVGEAQVASRLLDSKSIQPLHRPAGLDRVLTKQIDIIAFVESATVWGEDFDRRPLRAEETRKPDSRTRISEAGVVDEKWRVTGTVAVGLWESAQWKTADLLLQAL